MHVGITSKHTWMREIRLFPLQYLIVKYRKTRKYWQGGINWKRFTDLIWSRVLFLIFLLLPVSKLLDPLFIFLLLPADRITVARLGTIIAFGLVFDYDEVCNAEYVLQKAKGPDLLAKKATSAGSFPSLYWLLRDSPFRSLVVRRGSFVLSSSRFSQAAIAWRKFSGRVKIFLEITWLSVSAAPLSLTDEPGFRSLLCG